jgi:hypothetical protein
MAALLGSLEPAALARGPGLGQAPAPGTAGFGVLQPAHAPREALLADLAPSPPVGPEWLHEIQA